MTSKATLYLIVSKTEPLTLAQFIFRHDAEAFLAHLTKLMGTNIYSIVEATVEPAEVLTFTGRNRT
jgi:hypothetical protein